MAQFTVGDQIAATNVSSGYDVYRDRVGTVSRVFTVLGREKVAITYPPAVAPGGHTWTPFPFETFADKCERASAAVA